MKFSEIGADSWPELQPYLDTCLLPLSGLTGEESPIEATDKVARTGQWLAPLEYAFRGRTVTMPAYHYDAGSYEHSERINQLIARWRKMGFRYVVIISGQPSEWHQHLLADLFIQPSAIEEEPNSQDITKLVSELWQKLS